MENLPPNTYSGVPVSPFTRVSTIGRHGHFTSDEIVCLKYYLEAMIAQS